ncbi:MAG: polysaccharide biosynthesis C-terminal domain-containing protein [Bacteroidetes bacterium]|nr:polysaccharide biosynthesis C-terminal domain-containing protein [Bacteroidota bacterium]
MSATNRQSFGMQHKLISHSASIFVIRFFPALALLVVAILFSHKLPAALFGKYQALWVDTAILIVLAGLGLAPLALTHDGRTINRWLMLLKPRHVVLYGLWVALLGLILAFLLKDYDTYPTAALPILLLAQVGSLLTETYLIVQARLGIAALVSLLHALAFLTLHLLFLVLGLSFATLIWGIFLLSALRFCILLIVSGKVFRENAVGLRCRKIPRNIRRQWLQLGIYDLVQVAVRYVDKFVLAILIAPALFSVYFIGTTEVPFIPIVLGAVGSSLLQQMAKGPQVQLSKLQLMRTSGSILSRVVFPIFFFLFFFRQEFILFLFSEKYSAAVPLFAISILVLPLRAYNFTAILQHLNKVHIINLGAVLDLVFACSLAFPLYHVLGLKGIVWAFVVSSFFQAVFYLYHTSRATNQPLVSLLPLRTWLLQLLGYGILFFCLSLVLGDSFGLIWQLFVAAGVTVVTVVLSLLPIFVARS